MTRRPNETRNLTLENQVTSKGKTSNSHEQKILLKKKWLEKIRDNETQSESDFVSALKDGMNMIRKK